MLYKMIAIQFLGFLENHLHIMHLFLAGLVLGPVCPGFLIWALCGDLQSWFEKRKWRILRMRMQTYGLKLLLSGVRMLHSVQLLIVWLLWSRLC